MNLANQVTVARFVLSVVYFALLAIVSVGGDAPPAGMLLDAAFVLFVIAGASDLIDGYLARRYGTVTSFGRIADPFVDKILVCGSLVFLAAAAPTSRLLPAWMVVCILAREFLVHGLRSELEARGREFGARFLGKAKMAFQSVAVGGLLLYWGRLRGEAWAASADRMLVWAALVSTVLSGVQYLWEASRVLRDPAPLPGERCADSVGQGPRQVV